MEAWRSAVVVNPTKCDEHDLREKLEAALSEVGWPVPSWWSTTAEETGRAQTEAAIAGGAQVVFVCGGDGTVMECIGALAGTDVAMCVLPTGTGNLLARNLELPTDLSGAVAAAVGGRRRRIDVGVVDDRRFAVMAGIGFDARIMRDAPEGLKARTGALAYTVAAVRHLRGESMRVTIRLADGTRLDRRVRCVLVANIGNLQGGIQLLRDAEPDDGYLDVAVLAPRSLWNWLYLAGAVLFRRKRVPHLETFRTTAVEITAGRVQPRELDGDVIEPGRTLSAQIAPLALTVCVPEA